MDARGRSTGAVQAVDEVRSAEQVADGVGPALEVGLEGEVELTAALCDGAARADGGSSAVLMETDNDIEQIKVADEGADAHIVVEFDEVRSTEQVADGVGPALDDGLEGEGAGRRGLDKGGMVELAAALCAGAARVDGGTSAALKEVGEDIGHVNVADEGADADAHIVVELPGVAGNLSPRMGMTMERVQGSMLLELNIDQSAVLEQGVNKSKMKGIRVRFPSDRQLHSTTFSHNSFSSLSHD